MIKLSNGYTFTFCNGSGALAFNGNGWWWEQPWRWLGLLDPSKFTVVTKTLTILPIKGNLKWWCPWTCVRLLSNKSAVNAVGLTNPGIDRWIHKYYPTIKKYDFALSIKIDSMNEAYMFADIINHEVPDAKYVEVNVSCPNVKNMSDIENILDILKLYSNLPIILKLSYDQINKAFIESTQDCVEAFHCMNTVPWSLLYPDKPSPLDKYGYQGGVSGLNIKLHAFMCIEKLRGLTSKPIIGGGGIFDLNDIKDFEQAGATAFSIGTAFLYNPGGPNKIIKEYHSLRG